MVAAIRVPIRMGTVRHGAGCRTAVRQRGCHAGRSAPRMGTAVLIVGPESCSRAQGEVVNKAIGAKRRRLRLCTAGQMGLSADAARANMRELIQFVPRSASSVQ
jgi:hypothetical protein